MRNKVFPVNETIAIVSQAVNKGSAKLFIADRSEDPLKVTYLGRVTRRPQSVHVRGTGEHRDLEIEVTTYDEVENAVRMIYTAWELAQLDAAGVEQPANDTATDEDVAGEDTATEE